eukprot:TRINITY_DN1336_c0_g1_i4.p1 TRINITY_DN1336_c0_g1~~TRINITY_DN1336_c0_g1_i4.p1  ORF type:complete len:325 (+),score=-0.24 TRINITY_DN1336_c0_g1_i4:222-1196(+)
MEPEKESSVKVSDESKISTLLEKRRRDSKSYKEKGSSSDECLGINSIGDVDKRTSTWNGDVCISLGIKFTNASNASDIVKHFEMSQYPFSDLTLNTGGEFLSVDNAFLSKIKDKSQRTLLRKIRDVIISEESTTADEAKVDSFVMSLLYMLGFDEDPCSTNPQCKIKVEVNKHKITSIPEFAVKRESLYIAVVVEDKHTKNTQEINDWSEPQVAGEMLCSVLHNLHMAAHKEPKGVRYPIVIHALRVIGTRFTLYRSDVTRDYLGELESNTLPRKNSMTIMRFPAQSEEEEKRKLNAWDFCIKADRDSLIKALVSLRLGIEAGY